MSDPVEILANLPAIDFKAEGDFLINGLKARIGKAKKETAIFIFPGTSEKGQLNSASLWREWYHHPSPIYPRVMGISEVEGSWGVVIWASPAYIKSPKLCDLASSIDYFENFGDRGARYSKEHEESVEGILRHNDQILQIIEKIRGPDHRRRCYADYIFFIDRRWVTISPPWDMEEIDYGPPFTVQMEITKDEILYLIAAIEAVEELARPMGVDEETGLTIFTGRGISLFWRRIILRHLRDSNVTFIKWNASRLETKEHDDLMRQIALEKSGGPHRIMGLTKTPYEGDAYGIAVQGTVTESLYGLLAEYDEERYYHSGNHDLRDVYLGVREEEQYEEDDEDRVPGRLTRLTVREQAVIALKMMRRGFGLFDPFFLEMVLLFRDGVPSYLLNHYEPQEHKEMVQKFSHSAAMTAREFGEVENCYKIRRLFPELFNPQLVFWTTNRYSGRSKIQFRASTADELEKRKKFVTYVKDRFAGVKGRSVEVETGNQPSLEIRGQIALNFHNVMTYYLELDHSNITEEEEKTVVADFRRMCAAAAKEFSEYDRFLPVLFFLLEDGSVLYLLDKTEESIAIAVSLLSNSAPEDVVPFLEDTYVEKLMFEYPEMFE